jgi:hypothetical protein
VVRAQYPSLLAWDWNLANPYKWNVWLSLDGGVTYFMPEDYWAYGAARQFAPDGGSELHFIVGVDANGKEITRRSNAVRPDDAGSPLLTGLAAYWKLDETDPVGFATRQDELGNSDVAPQLSANYSDAGILNNGVLFSGGSTGLVGSIGNLSLAGDFAVSLWCYVNVYGDWQVAFHLYDSIANAECFRIQMYGPFDEFGESAFILFDGMGGGFTNAWLLPDQWHHLVVSVAGNTMSIYDNGVLVDTVSLSGTRPTPNQIRIGGNQIGYGWSGAIDEVGFWNRALTPTEVSTLYNTGNALAYEWF